MDGDAKQSERKSRGEAKQEFERKVKEANAFWHDWLKHDGLHPSKNGSGEASKSNALWIFESAFRAYLAAEKLNETHFFLLATHVQKSSGVHLGAGTKSDLAPLEACQAVHKYVNSPANKAYYLLVFVKDDIVLAFRKRLNPGPYVLATGDTQSALDFYDQFDLDELSPVSLTHILTDDE